jgi:putative Mg2+ transporter-C (MgtC) family protein
VAHLSNWDIILRLVVAALVGGAIGFERETDGQDAGLRTHMMLALGAAVFGVISVGAWDHFQRSANSSVLRIDVTRVASYVPAGIGFVGGGVIVKHAGSVKGLTTAASLWVAGAVGLAAGVGYWFPAAASTLIGFAALAARVPLRRAIGYVSARRATRLTIVLDDNAKPGPVVDALRSLPTVPSQIDIGPGEENGHLEIAAKFSARDHADISALVRELGDLDEVRTVNLGRV